MYDLRWQEEKHGEMDCLYLAVSFDQQLHLCVLVIYLGIEAIDILSLLSQSIHLAHVETNL
jgi:hypothetical protein